jgi:hypothetical protein
MQAEQSLPSVAVSELRKDQRRAYDIITWHLGHTIAGNDPPPLRMIMYGEGGTGKSKVIQTVTTAFALAGALYLLIKAAYTGKFDLYADSTSLGLTNNAQGSPHLLSTGKPPTLSVASLSGKTAQCQTKRRRSSKYSGR